MEKLLRDELLYKLLEKIDGEMAEKVRAKGCLICQSKVHCASYDRKPRGGPPEVLARWDKRASFCCERDGCRKRHTPTSVRFLGRKVYLGVVVVLVAAMMHGPNARRVAQLHDTLGMDIRTLKRWREWWLEHFVGTPFWKAARGRFMPVLDEGKMPFCMVEAFGGETRAGLIKLMEFLSPISTSARKEGAAM